ncbi:MAG: DUF4252 domain-containing protein [Tannerella sp.]|nr:DUF4252 domain-containing protein [Tannerella sp.]
MKAKYILIVLCVLCVRMGFAQDKLFEKYSEMDNVTSIYISKAMFRMIPNIKDLDMNLATLKDKIEALQLINCSEAELISRMRKDFSQLVQSGRLELMRIRDGKKRITFYSDQKGNRIRELLMLADTDSSFTVIQLTGDFTLKDIQDLTDKATAN